jgi:hypothetical protein
LPNTYEKPDIEDILDQDRHKDHHMIRDDAVNKVAKYETHQQDVTKIYSKMTDNTCLEEEECVDAYMDDAITAHKQDVTKAYKTNDDAQHQMMCGQSIPRAFFINQTLTEMKTEEEETIRGLQFLHISDNIQKQSGTIDVAKRPPMPDDTPKKEEVEPNVQVARCQEARRDGTRGHAHDEEFATITRYNKKSAATTLANYADAPETHHDAEMLADNIYDEESATDTHATTNEESETLTAYDEETAAVEGEPWVA